MQAAAVRNADTYTLDSLKDVVLKWLELDDPEIVDIIMATYVANNLSTDPLWVLLIAPPSHAKTELLRAFEGHRHNGVDTTYFISTLTPSTLASGQPKKKNDPEFSLVHKLTDKLVIFKDFTSILSMRSENQQEIIAQLREMYDGQYTKEFGNGVSIKWSGRFGLIGACTPVYDQHYGVIAQMGERFLLYRIKGASPSKIGRRALSIVGQEDEMRREIKAAVHRFIDQFQVLDDCQIQTIDPSVQNAVVYLACIVALGRCPVGRDRMNGEVLSQPAPEGTARLTKQLIQMGLGLAMVRGKTAIDKDVLKTLQKVARDLLPAYRQEIIEYLWRKDALANTHTRMVTKDIAEGTDMVTKTALRTLEDLMLTGIVKRSRDAHYDTAPYQWAITEEAEEYIRAGGLFE